MSGKESMHSPSRERGRISLLTWNVDGLCDRELEKRSNAACQILKKESADIILLQEVTMQTYYVFVTALTADARYYLVDKDFNNPGGYFTLTFIKDKSALCSDFSRPKYSGQATSQMFRDMSLVQFKKSGIKFLFINTHLESCKPSRFTREHQLEEALRKVAAHNDGPAFLCGTIYLLKLAILFSVHSLYS